MTHPRVSRRAVALSLAVLLLLGQSLSLVYTLAEGVRLGVPLASSTRTIAPDTELTQEVLYNGDVRQAANYVTYSPGGVVRPVVAYGNKLYGLSTINTINKFQNESGHHVMAAINADFFASSTGLPLGMVITEGVVRSSDAGSRAIGFFQDGGAMVGAPALSMQMERVEGGAAVPVHHINKLRRAGGGIYLLTNDFSEQTRNNTQGIDVLLLVEEGAPRIGGSMTAVVEDVIDANISMAIPDGYAMLTADLDSGYYDALAQLAVGDRLRLTIQASDPRWSSVDYAVGCGEYLVQNGQPATSFEDAGIAGINPRTAFGIKQDGSLVFYTLDGRRASHSTGATLANLASELAALGCVTAVNLDGGGSTAIAAQIPGKSNAAVVNRPSDGSARRCANYIMLVNTAAPTGSADLIHITPYNAVALAGSGIRLSAAATDANYQYVGEVSDVEYSVSGGSASGNTLWVPMAAGQTQIRAASPSGSGSAPLLVIETPETLTVEQQNGDAVFALNLEPSETVQLKASATYGGRDVLLSSDALSWEVLGMAATVDGDGLLTASDAEGTTGRLRVTAGELSVTVALQNGESPYEVESFERDGVWLTPESEMAASTATGLTMPDLNYVRYGAASLAVDYAVDESGTATLATTAPVALPKGPDYLHLWISADAPDMALTFAAADGSALTAPLQRGEDSGERLLPATAEVPEGAVSLTGLLIQPVEGQETQGRFVIDHITAGFGQPRTDLTPPEVGYFEAVERYTEYDAELDLEPVPDGYDLSATVADDTGAPVQSLTLLMDGREIPFQYDRDTLQLTAAVAQPEEGLHRFTVMVQDAYGNLARGTLELRVNTTGEPPETFADVEPEHWAVDYIAYVSAKNIVTGETEDDGLTYYRPSRSMTRAEFCAVLTRHLGLNVDTAANIQMPFDDLDDIAPWALPYVRAIYAQGLINGRADGSRLLFDAAAPITRGEMMTILGKTLPKGYPQPALTFTDADQVPAWAAPYVGLLTGLGIVNGYTDGSIGASGQVLRSEAAKVLAGMY